MFCNGVYVFGQRARLRAAAGRGSRYIRRRDALHQRHENTKIDFLTCARPRRRERYQRDGMKCKYFSPRGEEIQKCGFTGCKTGELATARSRVSET